MLVGSSEEVQEEDSDIERPQWAGSLKLAIFDIFPKEQTELASLLLTSILMHRFSITFGIRGFERKVSSVHSNRRRHQIALKEQRGTHERNRMEDAN